MSDQPNPAVATSPEPTPVAKTDDAIPYARFKEVNDQLKELKTWKDSREAEERSKQEQELIKSKKFDEVLAGRDAELKSAKQRLEEMTGQLSTYKDEEKRQREDLLAELKDETDKQIANELSLTALRRFVERTKTEKSGSPASVKGTKATGGDNPYLKQSGESYSAYQKRVDQLRSKKSA